MTAELVNLLDVITADQTLPKGYDRWAVRSVHPDLRSSHGFRWPFPGKVAKAAGPCTVTTDPCPSAEGDGICAAHTWKGMASGGIPAITLLLVAYRDSDVLADSTDKVRVRAARVVDVIDGPALLRTKGAGADLTGANLYGADLTGADLTGADLTGADLTGADLTGTDLTGTNLTRANLYRADLTGTNLTRANLYRADLTGANLTGTNLTRANLYRADLTGTNLTRTNLTRAIAYPPAVTA